VPAHLLAQDQALRAKLPVRESGELLVLSGKSEQEVLVQCETLLAAESGLSPYFYFDAPCLYLPSLAKQGERIVKLPAQPAALLQEAILASHTKLSRKPLAWQEFVQKIDQARVSTLLTPENLRGTALAVAYDALISHSVVPEDRWSAFVQLRLKNAHHQDSRLLQERQGQAEAALAHFLAQHKSIVRLSIKQESDNLYGEYFSEAVRLALLGVVAITLLLCLTYRSFSRALRLLAPLLLAAALSLSIIVLFGQRLNLLHVIGAMLVVAVGSNYALYFNQDQAMTGNTLLSLCVANVTTILGFGLLAFSQVPVLSALGSTVGLGAFLALLFSAALAKT
jgi:predicted exporter